MSKLKIVYMGSGSFGLPSFRHVLGRPDVDLTVVTQPDRPAGRGKKLHPTPIAAETPPHVPLKKYPSVNDPAVVEELRTIGMDILLVCDFGQILKQPVLDLARIGPYNIHGSALPAYRGAAPIRRAILDGARTTGVTILGVELKCDAGSIVVKVETEIGADENFGSLHDRLAQMAVPMICEFLDAVVDGRVPASVPQDESLATLAPKIKKEELHLSFDQPADAVLRRIRAFSPAPGAYALLGGEMRVKVLKARHGPPSSVVTPAGTIGVTSDKKGVVVTCAGDRTIIADELQPEGSRSLSAREFLNGYSKAIGAGFL